MIKEYHNRKQSHSIATVIKTIIIWINYDDDNNNNLMAKDQDLRTESWSECHLSTGGSEKIMQWIKG